MNGRRKEREKDEEPEEDRSGGRERRWTRMKRKGGNEK